jgi:predicted nucleic acid-binding protein
VTVTEAVRGEVLAGAGLPGARELADAVRSGWIAVAPDPPGVAAFPELDAGEASTLALALAHRGECLVLMDEPLGRAHARSRGLAVTELAGVLLAARRARLVRRLRPCFDRLEKSDFRISVALVRAVLDDAGEA